MSVRFRGKEFVVDNDKLILRRQGIHSIKDIEGLDLLADLQALDLRDNQITLIEGLEKLTSLRRLDLRGNPVEEWLRRRLGENAFDALFVAKWARDYCVNGPPVGVDIIAEEIAPSREIDAQPKQDHLEPPPQDAPADPDAKDLQIRELDRKIQTLEARLYHEIDVVEERVNEQAKKTKTMAIVLFCVTVALLLLQLRFLDF